MQKLPKDAPVAETVSFWFAGDHNLTMSPTGRAIVSFSMPGPPVGRRLNPLPAKQRPAEESDQPNGMQGGAEVRPRPLRGTTREEPGFWP